MYSDSTDTYIYPPPNYYTNNELTLAVTLFGMNFMNKEI